MTKLVTKKKQRPSARKTRKTPITPIDGQRKLDDIAPFNFDLNREDLDWRLDGQTTSAAYLFDQFNSPRPTRKRPTSKDVSVGGRLEAAAERLRGKQ